VGTDIADSLASFIKRPDQLKSMEECALVAKRPQVAFWLTGLAVAPARDYPTYLEKAADRMLRMSVYPAALVCLRDSLAETKENTDLWYKRAFRLAEVLGDMKENDSALEMLETISKSKITDDQFGQVAMLRLKNLFASQKHKTVLSEAMLYRDDVKYKKYLPQILYAGWAASQRVEGEDAGAWRKAFMEKFPDHIFGADIIYAIAMQELAKGKYDEAKRLLSYIEYKYPTAKVASKASEIRKRLEQKPSPTPKP